MNPTLRKRACFLGFVLLFMITVSSIFLCLQYDNTDEDYTAYIYQNGILLESIDLSKVSESYSITITSKDGGTNQILIQPNSICVSDADCPDLICVHQGIIRNNLLPITCLPHGLVIELKPTRSNIDTVTY